MQRKLILLDKVQLLLSTIKLIAKEIAKNRRNLKGIVKSKGIVKEIVRRKTIQNKTIQKEIVKNRGTRNMLKLKKINEKKNIYYFLR